MRRNKDASWEEVSMQIFVCSLLLNMTGIHASKKLMVYNGNLREIKSALLVCGYSTGSIYIMANVYRFGFLPQI